MKYTGSDFYCDVALKEGTSLQKEYESENVLAFHHTNPLYPVHIVVIPKKNISSFTSVMNEEMPIFLEMIEVIKKVAKQVEEKYGAARILTNLGKYQDSKHLHFHINTGSPIRPPVTSPKVEV